MSHTHPRCVTEHSGNLFLTAHTQGTAWRLLEGTICLEHETGRRRQIVQLALAGDLIGVDSLWQQPYRFNARALTAVRLQAIEHLSANDTATLMREALNVQQERSLRMACLRTGPVLDRLGHLLQMMGHGGHPGSPYSVARSEQIRRTLPHLKELAEIVDAKTETVCRVLAQLLPKGTPQRNLRLPLFNPLANLNPALA